MNEKSAQKSIDVLLRLSHEVGQEARGMTIRTAYKIARQLIMDITK